MARRDEIFKKFMEHEILITKYKIDERELPKTIWEAEKSDIPIVRVIAMIVKGLESKSITQNNLRKEVQNYLNSANTNVR